MTSLPLDDACLISEPLAEPKVGEPQKLKGFAVYLVPQEARANTLLKRDSSLIQLRQGLFARRQVKSAEPPLSSSVTSGILTFVPRRDTTKHHHTQQLPMQGWHRRFVLIVYRPFKNETLRKQFSRAVERTPVVRIRPGLLLAPQIPNSRYIRYTHKLQRPSQLLSKLAECGSPVWFVPRLELVHPRAIEIMNTLVRNTIAPRTNRIIQMCKRLFAELQGCNEKPMPLSPFKKQFSRIRRRFQTLQWQVRFFKTEFGLDLKFYTNRVLSAINRVRQQMKKCDGI